MGKSTLRSGRRRTHRTTKRRSPRTRKFRRKSRRSHRKGMGPGDKMTRMTLAQQFLFRDDLREAKKLMPKDEFRTTLKTLAAMETQAEQLEALATIGKPHVKPPKGRWTTDYTRGDKKFWCPHRLTCMTEDECEDFEDHRRAKGLD